MSDLQHDLAFLRGVVESSRRAARIDATPLLAWGVLTIAGVIGVYYFSGVVPAPAIVPIVATLFGVAYVASGALLDFRPAAAIGIAWWAVAVGLFAWPSPGRLALFGVAVLLLVVLPAAWMRRSDWSAS